VLETETIQGRRISGVEIAEIQALIAKNPQWSRRRVSLALAQSWQWYAASGQLKDMAARSLLLKLHERGLIALPERRWASVRRRLDPGPDLFDSLPPAPVVAKTLRPSDSFAGDLRAAGQIPRHLLPGGQLDPGRPDHRTHTPEQAPPGQCGACAGQRHLSLSVNFLCPP